MRRGRNVSPVRRRRATTASGCLRRRAGQSNGPSAAAARRAGARRSHRRSAAAAAPAPAIGVTSSDADSHSHARIRRAWHAPSCHSFLCFSYLALNFPHSGPKLHPHRQKTGSIWSGVAPFTDSTVLCWLLSHRPTYPALA